MAKKINLIIVDDEDPFRKLLVDRFSQQEFNVTGFSSGEEAFEASKKMEIDVGIFDIRMPGIGGIDLFKKIHKTQPYLEAIVLTGQATIDSAIEAMKLGAYDYLAKPCKLFELELIVRKAYEKKMLALENSRLKDRLTMNRKDYAIVGESEKIIELKKLVQKVASSATPILVYGEAGAGKEFVARAVHQRHRPSDAPFVTVNCGIMTHGLLENQLFGYEENAFTGAVGKKIGLMETSDGGTVYLEDVEELHPSTQVKLHEFLETGAFRRTGGDLAIRSDIRVIAGTQKDLREMVMKKTFREDLYYKLNVINIQVPPLRERKSDIPILIKQFLNSNTPLLSGKTFSQKAINAILKYDWPGNVRELHNIVERAAILSPKKTIQAKNIPIALEKKSKSSKFRHLMSLNEIEREHILHVLNATGGNISRAARVLGISRPKLYRKIELYKTAKGEGEKHGNS